MPKAKSGSYEGNLKSGKWVKYFGRCETQARDFHSIFALLTVTLPKNVCECTCVQDDDRINVYIRA